MYNSTIVKYANKFIHAFISKEVFNDYFTWMNL